MGMGMGRRVGVVVPVGMPEAIGMGAVMVVTMGVGRGGNHRAMLYYNITPVHGPWASFRGSPCGRPGMKARPYAFSNRDSTYSQFTRFSTNAFR